jgi:sugar lactone lactonase YvrE
MPDQLELIGTHKSLLGEGPVWLPNRKQLVWVDIENMLVVIFDAETSKERVITLNQRIGAIVPEIDGRMICALQHGFYILNLENESLELITDPEASMPGNRFNDGKCDAAGRFWAGTMPVSGYEPQGSLYCLHGDGHAHRMVTNIGCSNGIAWSSDNKIMYYIDTFTSRVDRFDFNLLNGEINNRQVAFHIPAELGFPDGMTIDSEGMLWVALWDGHCISRWNPNTGECLKKVELPVSRVTSCCFGGPDFDELYITTASIGLTKEQLELEPLAGRVFKYRPGVTGMPVNDYRFS